MMGSYIPFNKGVQLPERNVHHFQLVVERKNPLIHQCIVRIIMDVENLIGWLIARKIVLNGLGA